jgi:hypothetical protein
LKTGRARRRVSTRPVAGPSGCILTSSERSGITTVTSPNVRAAAWFLISIVYYIQFYDTSLITARECLWCGLYCSPLSKSWSAVLASVSAECRLSVCPSAGIGLMLAWEWIFGKAVRCVAAWNEERWCDWLYYIYIYTSSPYRAVNTLRLGYKNQSVNTV